MKKSLKKALALLLCLVLCFSMLPLGAWATEEASEEADTPEETVSEDEVSEADIEPAEFEAEEDNIEETSETAAEADAVDDERLDSSDLDVEVPDIETTVQIGEEIALLANSYTINGKTISKDSEGWLGYGQCWAYARSIYKTIWGVGFDNTFSGSSSGGYNMLRNLPDSSLTLTADHLKEYVSQAALGSVLRVCCEHYLHVSSDDVPSGCGGHSVIIVAKSSSGFTVFESVDSGTREATYTWSSFISNDCYKCSYIKYIKWPGASAYNSTPLTVSSSIEHSYRVSIPSSYVLNNYTSPTGTGYADSDRVGAQSSSYSIYCTAKYVLSDGTVRYRWTSSDASPKTLYFNYDSSRMGVAEIHSYSNGRCNCGAADPDYGAPWSLSTSWEDIELGIYSNVNSTDLRVYINGGDTDTAYYLEYEEYEKSNYGGYNKVDKSVINVTYNGGRFYCDGAYADYTIQANANCNYLIGFWLKDANTDEELAFSCVHVTASAPYLTSDVDYVSCDDNYSEFRINYYIHGQTTIWLWYDFWTDLTLEVIDSGWLDGGFYYTFRTIPDNYSFGRVYGILLGNQTTDWENSWVLCESDACPVNIYHDCNSLGHPAVGEDGYAATCTTDGLTYELYCGLCGTILYEHTVIPATGHTIVTDAAVPATCTTAGKTAGSHCSVCNAVIKAQTSVAATGHTTVTDAAVPATCTTAGKTAGSHCSVCNAVIKAQTSVAATGHTTVTDAAVPATCTTAGKTSGSHCSVCNAVIKAQTTIAATGHTTVTDAAVPATCTTAGKTAGSHCSVCNTVIAVQSVIPATGHSYGSGVVTTPATTSSTGVLTYTCSVCGDEKTESIPKLTDPEPVEGPTLTVSSVRGTPGKEVRVGISLDENPGIGALSMKINYDTSRLTLTGYENGSFTDWTVGIGGGEAAVWVNENGSTATGTILTLVFTVKEAASEGDATVTLSNVNCADKLENRISVTVQAGKVAVSLRTPGDVNDDGSVDVMDLLRLKRYLAGMNVTINEANADVTGDGSADVFDLLRLKRFLAGMNVTLE